MSKWQQDIEAVNALFETHFSTLSAEALNWKPNADSWSIAQVLDHLIKTNDSFEPVLKAAEAGRLPLPFMAKFGFLVRLVGRFLLKSVQPEATQKVKTFPVWTPSNSDLPADIFNQFKASQARFSALVAAAAPLVAQKAIITSPASRHIPYYVETAFDIVIAHSRRHLAQAQRVLAAYEAA